MNAGRDDRSGGTPGQPRRARPPDAGRGSQPPRQATGSNRRDQPPHRVAPQSPRDDRPRPPRHDEPPIPDEVIPSDLDREVRAELISLPKHRADSVARHLVMAGLLIDDDPEAAYQHALAARGGAGRIGAVREAIGLTAYRVGNYAEALSELRAARRITGAPDHLPVMADAERGLGRPERAVALANDPDAKRLDTAGQMELRIVLAGARLDLGQPAAAVAQLEGPDLRPAQLEPWTIRLWYAYADALLAAGRRDDARSYFEAAALADEDGETDAGERLAQLAAEPNP